MIGDTKSLVEVGVSMVLRDKFSSETGKISQSFNNMMNDMNDWNRAIQMSAGNAVQNSMKFLGGMAEAYQYSAKVQDTIFMASKIAGATAEQQTELMQLAQAINAVTPLTACCSRPMHRATFKAHTVLMGKASVLRCLMTSPEWRKC